MVVLSLSVTSTAGSHPTLPDDISLTYVIIDLTFLLYPGSALFAAHCTLFPNMAFQFGTLKNSSPFEL